MDKIQIADLLTKEIPMSQIYMEEPMKKHTSFKIGGNAEILVKVKNINQLEHVIKIATTNNIQITIVGNGSNLLVRDCGIKGIVIKLDFDNIQIEPIENDEYIVKAGCGVKLGALAQTLLKEEITGFEFAAGIPGTIGGAVKMNAGAYGGEMKDIVLETKCLNVDEYRKIVKNINDDNIEIGKTDNKKDEKAENKPEIEILNNEEQQFSYRKSIFNNKKYIILETKLKLHKGSKEEIKAKMDEYSKSRREKQPIQMPSAGSTFKRGEDFITAKLIDECGLKGYSIGDAEVSTIHAGFIVNKGNATAGDVIALIEHVQNTVYQKTGKKIELEIEVIGE